jgi:hypothetical protein|uniref:hypothetical protein n=1 Tax=Yoonia sp. TaxID=2212373 RepID=UPI0040471BE1
MSKSGDPNDPKGLVYESFRIEGITASECRTIFLDWALSMPAGYDVKAAVAGLLAKYADQPADHPMKATLQAALQSAGPARRRGGRAARVPD